MNNIFELLNIIRCFWKVLTKKRQLQIIFLLVFNLFSSIMEIISIASIMPFISAITDSKYFLSTELAKNILFIFPSNNVNYIFYLTVGFIFLNVLSGVIRLIALYFNVRISFIAGSDIGQELFRTTLSQNYEYHTKTHSSKLISLVSSKGGSIITNAVTPSINLINSFILFVILFFTLIYISPYITLTIVFVLTLVYFLIILFIKKIIDKESINVSVYSDKTMKILQESFGGIRDILLNNSISLQFKKYSISERKLRDSQSISGVISGFPRFIIEPIGMILLASIAYYLFKINNNIGESLSLLVVITVALQRLLPVMQQMYTNWSSLANSKTSLNEVVEQFDLKNTSLEGSINDYLNWNKSIVLQDVFFRYSSRPNLILKNVSLKINKGEIIGIVGESGSGKSTLIDVLSGLLKPTNGHFRIDDVEISTVSDLAKWRNSISVVSQRIFLIDSTLKENIAFGDSVENIDYEKLRKSIMISNLSSTVDLLPNGLDTVIGERGVQISGGQLQRIAIARAFYKNSSVLILDEFTSSLDSKTENEILNSITTIRNDFTIVIVSHKDSNLRICDTIYEVKDCNITKI
jgi:ABC-type multidrug transport system fused ATPase/permease subunit